MINTFPPTDTQSIKQMCLEKVNAREGFIVAPIKNLDGSIHHWEIIDMTPEITPELLRSVHTPPEPDSALISSRRSY